MHFNITHTAIKFDFPGRTFIQNYLVPASRMKRAWLWHLNTVMFSWQKTGEQWLVWWGAVPGASVHCCALNKAGARLEVVPPEQTGKSRAPGRGVIRKDWTTGKQLHLQNRETLCRSKMESSICLIGRYELPQSGLVVSWWIHSLEPPSTSMLLDSGQFFGYGSWMPKWRTLTLLVQRDPTG